MPDGSRSTGSQTPELDRVAALFRAHFAFVRRVLRRCGVAEADLDDAAQEVFLVVHRRIGDFEGRASPTTWLYAVAVRVASTTRRSASREQARRARAGVGMHASSDADPERELSRREAGLLLDSLLEELDGTKRTVFVLAELEGVPIPEIARIMDANLRTTHSRLRLARKGFRAALDRHQARESGRLRRTSLRTLARRAEPKTPDRARTRAAWAALAVRISDGATPLAMGATSAAATLTFSPWAIFGVTAALGVGVVAAAAQLAEKPPEPSIPTPVVHALPTAVPVASDTPRAAPPEIDATEADIVETSVERPKPPRQRRVRSSSSRSETPVGPSTLEAETRLLERARAKLRASDVDGALRLLVQHETQFPSGLLAAERDASRVRALCRGGRVEDARRYAGSSRRLNAVLMAACAPTP